MTPRDLAVLRKLKTRSDRGEQVQVDRALRNRLERLSSAGDAAASIALAWVVLTTRPRSKRRAEELYRNAIRGVNGNRRVALYGIAQLCFGSGRMREGMAFLRRSGRLGYSAAQLQLGQIYLYGEKVRRSLAEAEYWLRRAYRSGSAEAAMWLGWKRDFDDPGEKWREAAAWYRRAAENGVVEGMFNLAVCLERGLGIRADAQAARRWFEKAARAGDKDAIRKLASLSPKAGLTSLRASGTSPARSRARRSRRARAD
ncbi:MAG: sel1 repeat family protein [Archangium sp.]|nr:sel1 repeat family protein [Archangium sp.]